MPRVHSVVAERWSDAVSIYISETDAELADAIRRGGIERIRYAGPGHVAAEVRQAAAANGTCICDAPVLGDACVELLWNVHEQSISADYHRYGNLGARAGEDRAEVL
jgi:RHH-type proline utilization regulon transcriptional repressor/proline dehydrogenase/delta 1-pyrroline-5-carboxylate dehydrogenase